MAAVRGAGVVVTISSMFTHRSELAAAQGFEPRFAASKGGFFLRPQTAFVSVEKVFAHTASAFSVCVLSPCAVGTRAGHFYQGFCLVAGLTQQLAFCQLGQHHLNRVIPTVRDREQLLRPLDVVELKLLSRATSDALTTERYDIRIPFPVIPRKRICVAVKFGWRGGTRTCNLLIQSQTLYRWATRQCIAHGGILPQYPTGHGPNR